MVESCAALPFGLHGPLSLRVLCGGLRPPVHAASRFDQGLPPSFAACRSCYRTGSSAVWTVLFGSLPKEACVRSRAETRASIAQNLEVGNDGARDRVVTGLHVKLP